MKKAVLTLAAVSAPPGHDPARPLSPVRDISPPRSLLGVKVEGQAKNLDLLPRQR